MEVTTVDGIFAGLFVGDEEAVDGMALGDGLRGKPCDGEKEGGGKGREPRGMTICGGGRAEVK